MNSGTTIYEAAKYEWVKQICNILVPIIEEGFRNIYSNCVINANRARPVEYDEDGLELVGGEAESVSEAVITSFQQTLRNIPRWSDEVVDIEYKRILDYDPDGREILDDLIKAAFTSYILILSSANQSKTKVNLPIPGSKKFIHKVYIEAARVFYRCPHLFYSANSTGEYQNHKNNSRIEGVLCNSIEESIRKLMPIKMILQAFTTQDPNEKLEDAVIDEVEDITRRVSPRSRNGLRGVLKNYIKTTSEVIGGAPPPQRSESPTEIVVKASTRPDEDDPYGFGQDGIDVVETADPSIKFERVERRDDRDDREHSRDESDSERSDEHSDDIIVIDQKRRGPSYKNPVSQSKNERSRQLSPDDREYRSSKREYRDDGREGRRDDGDRQSRTESKKEYRNDGRDSKRDDGRDRRDDGSDRRDDGRDRRGDGRDRRGDGRDRRDYDERESRREDGRDIDRQSRRDYDERESRRDDGRDRRDDGRDDGRDRRDDDVSDRPDKPSRRDYKVDDIPAFGEKRAASIGFSIDRGNDSSSSKKKVTYGGEKRSDREEKRSDREEKRSDREEKRSDREEKRSDRESSKSVTAEKKRLPDRDDRKSSRK